MTHLLDVLGRGGSDRSTARFVTAQGTKESSFGDIWALSGGIASWFVRSNAGRRVAGFLTPSPEAIACMVGCLRAGRDFVSVPLPGRAQSPHAYVQQLLTILSVADASCVIMESAAASMLVSFAPELQGRVMSAESIAQANPPGSGRVPDGAGKLVQFSSGTTGAPKGVRLTGDAIGASLHATLSALGIEGNEVNCYWVPLSHDMGLIGGLFGTWAAAAYRHPKPPELRYVCIAPELFLARPTLWLDTCARVGAEVTAAPAFAYQVLARQLPLAPQMDLASLRVCLIGAEPIYASSLRAFAAAASAHQLNELALCPAYGLAEATLAVSFVRPSDPWNTRVVKEGDRTMEWVSCGKPLDCVEVKIDGEERPGPVLVRGEALCEGVEPDRPIRNDGWIDTGDLGMLSQGELVVTGRGDDLLCLAGRNIFAFELERELNLIPGVRSGNTIAVPDGRGRYVVLFEPDGTKARDGDGIFDEIRRKLVILAGVSPSGIGCLPRGVLPKTPSGKLQRNRVRRGLDTFMQQCVDYREQS